MVSMADGPAPADAAVFFTLLDSGQQLFLFLIPGGNSLVHF